MTSTQSKTANLNQKSKLHTISAKVKSSNSSKRVNTTNITKITENNELNTPKKQDSNCSLKEIRKLVESNSIYSAISGNSSPMVRTPRLNKKLQSKVSSSNSKRFPYMKIGLKNKNSSNNSKDVHVISKNFTTLGSSSSASEKKKINKNSKSVVDFGIYNTKKQKKEKKEREFIMTDGLLFNDIAYTLEAHYGTIYGLRQYKVDKEDFLISFSEDRTVKLWSCDFLREISKIEHDAPVRTACIIAHEGFKYIAVGSYMKDYPIGLYTFTGSFVNQIKVKGYTYYVDGYTDENRTFVFVSTYQPYNLVVYNFDTTEKMYTIPTTSYINSCIVTQFESLILTYIDRCGDLIQFNLDSGKRTFQSNSYGCYDITKWNERFYVMCGKGYGVVIVDINDLSIHAEYNSIHKDIVKATCKFQHHIYGDILITMGQDQRI
eukprot:CAMPEP_0170528302 /NCGR_PEP_ID=MMETSP0209-20121228/13808_1 /TAXON_ID=665100 ORGANISM="Litonotus pictus, Strain P1" /NCGR_SAMPLE_ID=MMETSP0209 /ASSEMBLY_ACC=CAM_ASM_000301 /LENGTH=432 /DNA_ID=CAMNT_0010819435 /DNA_START=1334 /DNA_END=2629 /DNA_ORIENTATION=+